MGGKILKFERVVNGISIEQRKVDGFINATAMCKAHPPKKIREWLRSFDAFESFATLALDLGMLSPCDNESDIKGAYSLLSGKSGLSAEFYGLHFPDLITVRRGAPTTSGNVWVHPDIAVYLAQWCNKRFMLQVSRWVREWASTSRNPLESLDFNQEWIALSQRYDIRIDLRDNLRPELMNVTVRYARSHGISPIRLCSDVHDAMNERIQGYKSKDLKQFGCLPLGDLLRDYFDTKPLQIYSAINKLAFNAIEDEGAEPVSAVHRACDRYLSKRYIPEPVPIVENVHQAMASAQAKRRSIQAAKPKQLGLFEQAS